MTKLTDKNNQANNQSLQQSRCIRIPFWLDANNGPFFCWLHLPNNQQIHDTGLVICNPMGFEYTHSHRSLRHLSDALAEAGYATIRFDYHGTGDSFGDLFDKQRLAAFESNIDSAINALKEKTQISSVGLIGLRLGGTFAAEYCSQHAIDKLVLWSSCRKGKSYVREAKALQKLAAHQQQQTSEFVDSGGFIMTQETASQLSQINLLKQTYQVNQNVLLIERDDFKTDTKLADTIAACSTATVEQTIASGYADMMAEPQETQIPNEAIGKIISWLNAHNTATSLTDCSLSLDQVEQTAQINQYSVAETILYPESSKLLSIFSYQKNFDFHEDDKPLMLLANSGSVHRVGPNRVYVELARALAAEGYPVIRFDLRNLGDSVSGFPQDENSPYSHKATEDIAAIIHLMREKYQFKRFIVAGLCSGAHNAFHAGLELDKEYAIEEVILINPLAFYRKPGIKDISTTIYQVEKDSQQYTKSLLSLTKWKKLFSGNVDLGYLLKFVSQKIARVSLIMFRKILGLLRISQGSKLAKDFSQYAKNKIALSVFIASKDPGERIIRSEANSVFNKMIKNRQLNHYPVANADHTFSSLDGRNNFIQTFVEHVKNNNT